MRKQLSVLIAMALCIAVHGQSIFTTQALPTTKHNDSKAIELGVKFRTTSDGTITGVKFYKVAGSTGTHTGELYSSTGTRLAQGAFVNETASGWQSVTFNTPVSIVANTTYVAAVFSSAGDYVVTNSSFGANVTNGAVSALQSGVDGANGIYIYTTTPAFPNTFCTGCSVAGTGSNYWVDVSFSVAPPPPPPPPAPTMTTIAQHGLHAVAGYAIADSVSTYLVGGGQVDSRSVGQTSYKWFQKSGGSSNIVTPDSLATKVLGLHQGVYVYGFILKDNRANLSDTAYKTVTVN